MSILAALIGRVQHFPRGTNDSFEALDAPVKVLAGYCPAGERAFLCPGGRRTKQTHAGTDRSAPGHAPRPPFPSNNNRLTRVLVAGIAFLRTCGRTPRPQPHRPVAGRGCAVGLTLVQLPASAAIALACLLVFEDWQGLWRPMSASAAVGIVFLGAIATGGAFLALSWAQTRLDSTTTAVILTLEPVVGASLGIALGDTWTGAILAGGIAVLTAVVLVARTGGRTVSVTDLILERTLNRVRQQIRRPHLSCGLR